VICGIFATLAGSELLRKMMSKYEEMKEKDEINAEVLELIRVEKCTLIMTVGTLFSTIFMVCFLLPSFFMGNPWNYILEFIGLTLGEITFFLGSSSVGISLMICVPTNLRGQANAVSAFIMHLTGDFPSPFIVGALFDTIGYLFGMLFLMCWLFFAFIFWFIAYKLTKTNLLIPSKAWPNLLTLSLKN
jgi:hypothetical protein